MSLTFSVCRPVSFTMRELAVRYIIIQSYILVLMYLSKCFYQEIKCCGLWYHTEQTLEIVVVNNDQNSREETTNEPGSTDGGTLSGGSAKPRIFS